MSDGLADLLARVEAAEGADRELNFDIARWEGWTEQTDEADPVYVGKVSTWWAEPGETDWSTCSYPPDYTRSLDASLALVERKLGSVAWALYRLDDGRFMFNLPRVDSGFGATAALSALAALLKALIAQEQAPA